MPEYLAPGVYVEEVSFRAKSIEGVSTTTTGFIGPTRYGPLDLEPDVITSMVEFERIYGDRQPLEFGAELAPHDVLPKQDNFMWHAARAFFEQGGKRLYVQRVFRELGSVEIDDKRAVDGRASARLPAGAADNARHITVKARYPGVAGSRAVRVTLRLGPNVLTGTQAEPRVSGLRDRDVVWVEPIASPIASPLAAGEFYIAEVYADEVTGAPRWRFTSPNSTTLQLDTDLQPAAIGGDQVRVVSVVVTALPPDADGLPQVW